MCDLRNIFQELESLIEEAMRVEKKNANHDIYDKALRRTESSRVLMSFIIDENSNICMVSLKELGKKIKMYIKQKR